MAYNPLKSIALLTHKGVKTSHATVARAAEYTGLKPQTVRQYLSDHNTNTYVSRSGITIEVIPHNP